MADVTPPDESEDINEVVSDEWESETTPYEHVRHAIHRSEVPVAHIANLQ